MFKKSAAPSGYFLTKSLRFRSSASAYLNRTPASSPTDAKKYTYSAWIKKSKIATSNQFIYGCGSSGSDETYFGFNGTDAFEYLEYTSSAYQINVSTAAVFRDPSAWYHLVLVLDTTQATSTNRIKLYINGVQQTLSGTFPSLNYATSNVNSTDAQNINRLPTSGGLNFDGYYAEINMVDGQALTPSSFGSTNATTGVWQPAKYTGTYGTNGFYLKFTDTTSTATLGTDYSGNSNTWTTNNFSLTTGSTYDSMTDVPTLTSATTANYCVLNPLDWVLATNTITDGNLNITTSASSLSAALGTLAVSSGKWYFEFIPSSVTGIPQIGIVKTPVGTISTNGIGQSANAYVYLSNGNKANNNSFTSYGATYTNSDVIGVALDLDAGTLVFYKNNTSQGTAFTGLSGQFFPVIGDTGGASTIAGNINFGQQPFTYTPPTGFVALNTYNLPDSTIVKGNTVMDATLYTGTGGTQSIVNAAPFKPDMVWIKSRSGAYDNNIFDSVRGVYKQLVPNANYAENNYTTSLTAFNSNGFSLGSDIGTNNNGSTFVGWQWQAGQGSTSSNTNGSITSTVSVNATAGFSIATYTGTGANATVGHGLGVAPSMIIVKKRSAADSWQVYNANLTSAAYRLVLNATSAQDSQPTMWNSTAPTSSVFSIGTDSGVNTSSGTYVAYCWSQIAGFSSFGSYTGNGSSDGPFVYTGFRPKFVLMKSTTGSNNWIMYDTVRNTYNLTNLSLVPDSSAAENGVSTTTENTLDILSNGFKLRTSNALNNGSSVPYIYMAFAENPFKNALAR